MIDGIIGFFRIDEKFLRKKLKDELKKYDDTIEEMLAYENVYSYVRTIITEANPKTKTKFLKELKTLYSLDSKDILKLAKKTKNNNLVNKLKDMNIKLNGQEYILAMNLLKADYNRPQKQKIKNIAFSGGGAKGIAHLGTIKRIEEEKLTIEAVSGTSAGAITALPFALGYQSKKIEDIVLNYDFTSFLQESILNKSSVMNFLAKLSSSKRALMYRSDYLEDFTKELKKPFLKYLILKNKHEKILGISYPKTFLLKEKMDHLERYLLNGNITLEQRRALYGSAMESDLNSIIKLAEMKAFSKFKKNVIKTEKNITPEELDEKLKLGFKNHTDALKTFFRILKKEDVIEEFFGDLIENQLKSIDKNTLEKVEKGFSNLENLRNMNFKQFEKLRELCPNRKFRDLGICICQQISPKLTDKFVKNNYKQIDVHAQNPDKEYSEMAIKTAVRISMNLPGAFSSYKYKDKKYVDGGVRANFPLHFFDKTKKEMKRTTIGFALAPEENYRRTKDVNNLANPETPIEIIEPRPLKRLIKKSIIKLVHYYNHTVYGAKLDNNNPFDFSDLLRVGFINVLDVGTNDFNISKTGKKQLIHQGYKACKNLLSPNYEAQLFHYQERIRAINKHIKEIEHKLIDKDNENKYNEEFINDLISSNYSNILEHNSNKKVQKIINPIEATHKKRNFLKKRI